MGLVSTEPTNPFAPPSTHRVPSEHAAPSDRPEQAGAGRVAGAPGAGEAPTAGSGVAPVGYAPTGHPSTGYPQTGYPQTDYPQTDYPQTGQQQPGSHQPGSHQPGSQQPGYASGAAGQVPGTERGVSSLLPTETGGPKDPLDSWGRPARTKRPRRSMSVVWVVPMLVLALLAGGLGGVAADRLLDGRRPVDADLPLSTGSGAGSAELTGVAAVAAEVLPSVVSIEVRSAQGEGTGSGFVLRDDGYILTNNHVVSAGGTIADGAAEIVVVFSDGSEEPAELVGRTSEYDLAVIKVDRQGLAPLVLGDSDDVVVGDPVVAVGAPLGLQGTVTTGIVSALNRPVSAGSAAETAFINAIQTDAAINPGNSGGPLVDANGEVIGINSAIAQRPGVTAASGSIGLGFAIPSNQARRTAEELIETGRATYPVIGVLLDQRYTGEGVQVSTEPQNGSPPVTPGGPAEAAGIQPGDVIVAIDGRPVTEADELIVAIRAKAPGDAVTLTIRADGGDRDVRVVLDELPGS
jgi:putative serine protease PepD